MYAIVLKQFLTFLFTCPGIFIFHAQHTHTHTHSPTANDDLNRGFCSMFDAANQGRRSEMAHFWFPSVFTPGFLQKQRKEKVEIRRWRHTAPHLHWATCYSCCQNTVFKKILCSSASQTDLCQSERRIHRFYSVKPPHPAFVTEAK